MEISINMKASEELLNKLKGLNIHQHSGKIHKDSFFTSWIRFLACKGYCPTNFKWTSFYGLD